jgi:hypothetical protein
VVGAGDDHDVGTFVFDDVQALEDRICRTEVPVLADPLLRRDGGDVVTQLFGQLPCLSDVAVKRVRFVLREYDDT